MGAESSSPAQRSGDSTTCERLALVQRVLHALRRAFPTSYATEHAVTGDDGASRVHASSSEHVAVTIHGTLGAEEGEESKDVDEKVSFVDLPSARMAVVLVHEESTDSAETLVRLAQALRRRMAECRWRATLWVQDTLHYGKVRAHVPASGVPYIDGYTARAALREEFAREDAARYGMDMRCSNACGASAHGLLVCAEEIFDSRETTMDEHTVLLSEILVQHVQDMRVSLTKRLICHAKEAATSDDVVPVARALAEVITRHSDYMSTRIAAARFMVVDRVNNAIDLDPAFEVYEELRLYTAFVNACNMVAQLYLSSAVFLHIVYGDREHVMATRALLRHIEAHGGKACTRIDSKQVIDAAFPLDEA